MLETLTRFIMQSFLQYCRTGRDVHSKFSKLVAHRRAPEAKVSPSEPEGESQSESSLATDLSDGSETLITQDTIKNDLEAGPLGDGVTLNNRTTGEGKVTEVFAVSRAGEHDPTNPKNWSKAKRVSTTLLVALSASLA